MSEFKSQRRATAQQMSGASVASHAVVRPQAQRLLYLQRAAGNRAVQGLFQQGHRLLETGGRDLSSGVLQRDDGSEAETPWTKLSPSVRKQAQELWDRCEDAIDDLINAQIVHESSLRSGWLANLRRIRSRIEGLDSDAKLTEVEELYEAFLWTLTRAMHRYLQEWVAVKERYLNERRWLLSLGVKSTDSIEAAKYLEGIYRQTEPWIATYVTRDDYFELKHALDKQAHIRVGMLRGTRIRTKRLDSMMDTVADLLRKGEDANKFIPGWSDRVLEEAAHLDYFAKFAKEQGYEYHVELADSRKELLEKRQETLKIKPSKGAAEKVWDLGAGAIDAVLGIFVEAGKEAVDLVQINLHFVSFGKYEPIFISDMAAAADQGATTGDLLKGFVTGIVDTPSRFLQACREGDWKAIGREAVNLYMLAKTVKQIPAEIGKIPGLAKKLPGLLAKTRESLAILRQRTLALGLKNEPRLSPGRSTPAKPAEPTGTKSADAGGKAEPATAKPGGAGEGPVVCQRACVPKSTINRAKRTQYKKDVRALDNGVDLKGHSYADHGAQTTPAQHQRRLQTGVTPGGATRNIPQTSSKFATHEAHLRAYEKALKELGADYLSTSSRMKVEFTVPFDMPGSGFIYSLNASGALVRTNAGRVFAFFKLNSHNWYDLITMYPAP